MAAQSRDPGESPGHLASPEPDEDFDPTIITGRNTRVRASNAMDRARAAAVQGAMEVLVRRGVAKLTMAEVADRSGLARATLYNHVRDKDALLALVVGHEAEVIASLVHHASSVAQGLTAAAEAVVQHPVVTALRAKEPLALQPLHQVAASEAALDLATWAMTRRGREAEPALVDLVLRWLVSEAIEPSDPRTRAIQAETLARALR